MSSGFPDWQGIQQWFGATVWQGTNQTLNAGSQASGDLQLASWASVIVWCKAQVQAVTITVTQQVTDGPAALINTQVITCAAGATIAQSVVLVGDLVNVTVTGGGAGCIADWAILPSNTTTSTSVTSVPIITRVTALPAAPADTQVIAFVPDAAAFPGVEWLCIYNASTGFWDVIGGAPLYVYDAVATAVPNTAAWTSLGLTALTLAREGYYDCVVNAVAHNTFGGGAAETDVGLRIDGVDPVSSQDSATVYSGAAGPQVTVERPYLNQHIAAAGTVRVVYMSQQTSTIRFPKFTVMPRRIK